MKYLNIACLTALLALTGCGGEDAAESGDVDRGDAQIENSLSSDAVEANSDADPTPKPTAKDGESNSVSASNTGKIKDSKDLEDLDKLFPNIPDIPTPKVVGLQPKSTTYQNKNTKARWQIKQFSDDSELNHGPYTEYWSNGQIFKEGKFEDGIPVGDWKYWHDNGQLSRELKYKNGQLLGTFDVFREDGTQEATRSYRNGLKDGEWKTYDDTGEKVILRFHYRRDLRHDKWASFYLSGEPKVEEFYKDDQKDGKHTVWYDNGQKAEEMSFRDGKRHGKAISWNKDGTKRLEIEYQNGEPVSEESDTTFGT